MQQYVATSEKRQDHSYFSTLRANASVGEPTTAMQYAFHKAALAHALAYARCEHDEANYTAPEGADKPAPFNPAHHAPMTVYMDDRHAECMAWESMRAIEIIAEESL